MGSKATSSRYLNVHQFSSVLSSAALEWLLLLLLFVNSAFSYLITKFAKKSRLQPPCVLCSRLDRTIGRSGPAFYHDLLCDSHKMEMSSLAYCGVHRRLSNVHTMCQKCLYSSNHVEKHSYSSSGNLLSIEYSQPEIYEVPLLRDEVNSLHESPESRCCSCCNEPPLNQAKDRVFKLIHDTIDRGGIELIDASQTGMMNHAVKLEKDADQLPHVEYSELKTEDSNSELHTNGSTDFDVSRKKDDDGLLEPFLDGKEREGQRIISTDSSTLENTLDELHDHDQPDENAEKHLPREMLCKEQLGANMDIAIEKDKSESNGAGQDGISATEEPAKDLSSENPNPNPNPIPSQSGSLSLTDAYNFAIRNRDTTSTTTTSPRYEDVITGKDSSRVYEELKLLISQFSAARGIDSPWADVSPRMQQSGDESVLHNITKTLSIGRSESIVSMEGSNSIVSEIEGESTVDRFKRQIDLDRKSISLLYKELEEERSASAIAANQAMAMITRLQEEKAAMQMEALQYQRVMEEQVEYDQEALQKCNEIISQKDKYIEELEANFSDISSLGNFEGQKSYISEQLCKLERKLHHFSNTSSSVIVKSPQLDTIEEEEVDEDNFSRENGEVSEPVTVKKTSTSSSGDTTDFVQLQEEISRLSNRLKALEADHNFLEHSLNSLKNGQEGARFIREIAISLRELRDLGISPRNRE